MTPKALPPQLARAARAASKLGLPAFAVGGCVRDSLLGRPTKDVDIAVEGPVELLLGELGADADSGARMFDRFGTARWPLPGGGRIDVARTRKEVYPTPAALPVVEPAEIRTDLFRRDFTINAMAMPLGGFLERRKPAPIDPYGGLADLRRGELRILHPQSFRDDPTRIFRAARFAARFGFKLEKETRSALAVAVREGYPRLLSRERLREELLRILDEREPAKALSLLRGWGALDAVHGGLRWPKSGFDGGDRWVRLGLLALCLGGREGRGFLEELHLEREIRLPLEAALEAVERRASPREPLTALTVEVLRRGVPRLAPAALKPPLAGGDALKKLGLPPGPLYARLLDDLAKAQWSGKVRTRRQALGWLRRKV